MLHDMQLQEGPLNLYKNIANESHADVTLLVCK